MKSKVILITGAGSGFGKAAAVELARRGHRVLATTHKEEDVGGLQALAAKEGIKLESFKLDVTSPEDRLRVLNYEIEVLINNAGTGESGSLADIPVQKIRDNFEVNVFAPIELTQLVLKGMMKRGQGTVIFISSLGGRVSMPFLAPYSMTKFALSGGIDAFRQEVKKISKNIFISLVEPGAYHTGFNQKNISKKYEWMNSESPFYDIRDKLKRQEELQFKVLESKDIRSIVKKIVKSAESRRPALRYTAPWWQAAGVQLLRIFGK
ncbi:MAG: SDR family NAD(P)-dependent oxidoreductase [Cytophagaceae bacterium]